MFPEHSPFYEQHSLDSKVVPPVIRTSGVEPRVVRGWEQDLEECLALLEGEYYDEAIERLELLRDRIHLLDSRR